MIDDRLAEPIAASGFVPVMCIRYSSLTIIPATLDDNSPAVRRMTMKGWARRSDLPDQGTPYKLTEAISQTWA